MSRSKIVVLCGLMFLAGAAVGGYVAWRETIEIMANVMGGFGTTSAEAGVSSHVAVLQRLRAGQTAEGTEYLETLLDGDILALALPSQKQLTQRGIEILRRARVYREQFPHSTKNAEVDAAVRDALARAQ